MNRCALRADWEAIVDHPLPWLRYVDADDVDDDTIDFDGMDVQSPTGEHLGDVEGFIVDSQSGRPYYVVVDAGGWFKSKHFLLPVGHARVEADAEALVTDLDRDRVNKFPGFDKDEFDKLTEADLRRINDTTCAACSVEDVAIAYAVDEPIATAWERPDFRRPDWWRANPAQPERMGERAVTAGAETAASTVREAKRTEEIRAKEVDPSPHYEGRAQPGDVLGVETGGERTHIGETAEDENDRRRDAEKTDAKRRR
jgi:PRC-barrel domain